MGRRSLMGASSLGAKFFPWHRQSDVNQRHHVHLDGTPLPSTSVFHPQFGLGVLTSIWQNVGDLELMVIFQDKRIERLTASNGGFSGQHGKPSEMNRTTVWAQDVASVSLGLLATHSPLEPTGQGSE